MKYVFFFLAITCFPELFSQTKTCTVTLYYNINEISSPANSGRLDSLYNSLGTSAATITVYGYADFLSSPAYNVILSQKRADAVKRFFIQKENHQKLVLAACKGLGEKNSEDNNSAEGEPAQRRVDVIVAREGISKKIGTRENKTQQPEKNHEAEPVHSTRAAKKSIELLEKGQSMAIEGLNFIPGRHILVKGAISALEELLSTLKEHSELKIEIQGHICCLDEQEEDGLDYDTGERKLSENRAKSIYNYLIKNGIDAERLTYKGYGHTSPKIKFERSPEDEQANRRVEIKILEN